MAYLISYDQTKPEKDCANLTEYLHRLGAKRVLFSEWLVVSNSRAVDLCNNVMRLGSLDTYDRILVTELLSSATAWYNLRLADGVVEAILESARG